MHTEAVTSVTPTDEHEFQRVYFTIAELLNLPDDDDPHGPCGDVNDAEDTPLSMGLDFNRIASTGSAHLGDDDLRSRLAPFIDPTLNFAHCLAALHGIRAHLASLNPEDLQTAKDGMFRARRLVRAHMSDMGPRSTTTVHQELDVYRAKVHRIEQRIENVRRRTPVAVVREAGPVVHPLASGWSVMWHLCVAHGLGGPAGEAMAYEIMDAPFSAADSLVGLTDSLRMLCHMDPAERSEALSDMDSARRYFYPVLI